MEELFKKLNISKSSRIERFIPKKMFYENAELGSTDRKIFTDHVEKIIWQYSLKPENVNVKTYKDEIRDYAEIEVILVKLNQCTKAKRIAEIVMKSIPYPILLVFSIEDKLNFYVAHQRQNLNDASKITVDEFISTDWIDQQNKSELDEKLFNSLDFKTFNHSNFYKMYCDLVDKINIYNASKLSGHYLSNTSANDAKLMYDQVNEINVQIEQLKSKVKQDAPISERVSLNVEINELKAQKNNLLTKIR